MHHDCPPTSTTHDHQTHHQGVPAMAKDQEIMDTFVAILTEDNQIDRML